MKKTIILLAVLFMATMLTACAGKDKLEVTGEPTIELTTIAKYSQNETNEKEESEDEVASYDFAGPQEYDSLYISSGK